MASLLASHGFTALALAYFGIKHLPKQANNIPLEYVKTAIDWMQSRKDVASGWLGIHGTSKGGELALLSAVLFKQIKAVVSLSSGVIHFAGIVPWSDADFLPPSWTYNGKPLPYATPDNNKKVALECLRMKKSGEGNPLGKWHRYLSSDPEIVKAATIPVEKIQGPILFITGQDDGDIPDFVKIGIDRLKKSNHAYEYIHLNYKNGTHAIGIPYVRVTSPGHSAKDVAVASEDSWQKTKEFFTKHHR